MLSLCKHPHSRDKSIKSESGLKQLNCLLELARIRCRWHNSCQKAQPKTSTDSQVTSLLPKSVDRRTQRW